MRGLGGGPAPELVPNPRPRTPQFRPPRNPALVALYPLHTVLAGFVAGLLAGPRLAPAVLLGCAGAAGAGAAVLARSGRTYEVAVAQADDDELARLGATRPASVAVQAARVGATLVGAVVALLAGAVVAQERLAVLDRTALAPRQDARLVGVVTAPPRTRSFGTTVVTLRVRGESVLVRSPDRVRSPRVRVGDELAVRGDLRRPRARERRGNVHGVVEAQALRATGRTRSSPVDAVRRRAEDALAIGLAPEAAALARGMVLGQDQALPEDLREAFRTAGLAHLLAASGQNVMLLAALVLALASVAGIGLRARLAWAVAAVAFYVPLAGAGPSIQRAGVMGAAGLVAALAGRPASRWYALLLAGAGTLVLDPRAAEDVGWQLSFAAVVSIMALHRRLRTTLGPQAPDLASVLGPPAPPRWLLERVPDRAGGGGRPPDARAALLIGAAGAVARPLGRARRAAGGALADVAALTIAATLGTAPLLSLHFGELSLVSLPANVLAAPAVAPVMWLGTLAGVLGAQAAHVLNAAASVPLAYLAWLGRTAASVPCASVALALPGPLAAVAAYGLVAAACAVRLGDGARRRLVRTGLVELGPRSIEAQAAGVPARLRPRWRAIAPAGVLLAVTALLLAPGPARPPDGPTLSALAVGQGDAILLQDGERAALFDTGRPGAPLVQELRRSGVRRLDLVVVTHSSSDHEGGLEALLAAMPVGMVLDGRGPGRRHGGEGGGARFDGVPRTVARGVPARGQRFAIGRIDVEILWPPPSDPRRGDPNLTATVALARTRTTTALLTADAESPVTLALDLPPVDVLKVAHHGSRDEGLAQLLARLRPRTAVIPVGRNTYGHPAPETLAALRAVPDVRRTDRDGTTRVALGA